MFQRDRAELPSMGRIIPSPKSICLFTLDSHAYEKQTRLLRQSWTLKHPLHIGQERPSRWRDDVTVVPGIANSSPNVTPPTWRKSWTMLNYSIAVTVTVTISHCPAPFREFYNRTASKETVLEGFRNARLVSKRNTGFNPYASRVAHISTGMRTYYKHPHANRKSRARGHARSQVELRGGRCKKKQKKTNVRAEDLINLPWAAEVGQERCIEKGA